jgi:hypothetical protein
VTASPLQIALRQIHLGLLWGASLLVPSQKRAEWSQEWRSELWYVLRGCVSETNPDLRSLRGATAFCLGAFQDAIWLRKRSLHKQQLLIRIHGSAYACLLLLVGTLFFTWGIAHISPRIAVGMSRIQVYPWRMSTTGAAPCDCPFDLGIGRRSLRATQLLFDGFSHYNLTQETVWSDGMPKTGWTVAHARSDFFDVIHLPVQLTDTRKRPPDRSPQVVLGRGIWMREFRGEPNVAGAKLHIGSVKAIVAGVAFSGSTDLPGNADAWLLSSDLQVGSGKSEFVVGHLSPVGYFDDGRWALSVGGILLAFLVFPFVSRPSIGEYGLGSHKPSLARRCQFLAFLIAKIATILAIAYFASVDLACLFAQPFSQSSDYLQAASSIALCLLGLGWAFRDQRRRCPICLRSMVHPVEVGQPSRTFLDWNGLELVCERGHGLLHIPETLTSWFGAQRWVCLDGSWQFLFARSND